MKVDKTLVASVALHVAVLGWGLVSFAAKSLEAPPPESMPVDIISADQFSKITAGSKLGDKDKPKPLVEKIAEAKPVDDPAQRKPDITLARTLLGWEPEVTLEEGLAKTAEWFSR